MSDDEVLSIEEAAARMGTDPQRLAARLFGTGRTDRRAHHQVPEHRRSSFNEAWWIDDDGGWTDGRDRIPPSAQTADAWAAAVAASRRAAGRGRHRPTRDARTRRAVL